MPDTVNSQIIGQPASRDPQDAWEEFLRQYSDQIFHVIRTYEADVDRAGDCFQFICERLIEGNFSPTAKIQRRTRKILELVARGGAPPCLDERPLLCLYDKRQTRKVFTR